VSSCLFCQFKMPLLDVPIGMPGDPVGLCVLCNSLSCGWHGARTSAPAFLCLVCDVNGLLASAGWDAVKRTGGLNWPSQGRGAGTTPAAGDAQSAAAVDLEAATDLARALGALFSTADGGPSRLVVVTLMQWLADRPSYERFGPALAEGAEWAVQVINRFFRGRQVSWTGQYVSGTYDQRSVQAMWETLGEDGRRLLAAAVLLVVTLELPWETLPPSVLAVAQFLGGLLRDYPDRITPLRERISGSAQR
jgi:hypothetical protein